VSRDLVFSVVHHLPDDPPTGDMYRPVAVWLCDGSFHSHGFLADAVVFLAGRKPDHIRAWCELPVPPSAGAALTLDDLLAWSEILDDLAYKDELEYKEPSADMRRLAARLRRAIEEADRA
jgi:hypothetical protein